MKLTMSTTSPITSPQTTDLGTEVQRHLSQYTGELTFEQAKYLFEKKKQLDRWAIAALRLRVHGLCVGFYPEDIGIKEVHKQLFSSDSQFPRFLSEVLVAEATILVASAEFFDGQVKQCGELSPDCFWVIVGETKTTGLSPQFFVVPAKAWPQICGIIFKLRDIRG